jgi:hypothetical protein
MVTGDASAHTLVGAYAMDAVSDADRARFELHLAECSACQEEIREMREATARLAVADAVVPRPELKALAMQAAAQVRQLPPVTGPAAEAVPGLPGDQPGRLGAGWPGRGWPAGRDQRQAGRGTGRTGTRGTGTTPWRRLGLAAGAALAAVAVVLAISMHGAQRRLDQAQRGSAAVARVLASPDAAMLTAHVVTGGSATVVMSHAERKLVFTAAGLRALPAAERYELWLMGPSGKKPVGMLPSARSGMSGPVVVSGLAAGDRIGMTVEPAAGSPQPTSPPVLMLRLSRTASGSGNR